MKIPIWKIDEIIISVRHILYDQSSITLDFVKPDYFCEWNRIDTKYIEDSLELLTNKLKEMEIKE